MNFALSVLAMEREEGEYITTFGKVEVGQTFRVNGYTYTKVKDMLGHKYDMNTHQEETVVYNAQRLLDDGEHFSYFAVPVDTFVLAKED